MATIKKPWPGRPLQAPRPAHPKVSPRGRILSKLLFDTVDLLEDVKKLTGRLRKELLLDAGGMDRLGHPAIEASRGAESALRQVRGLLTAALPSQPPEPPQTEADAEEINPDDFL
ncbi:hypothetical protein LVJ94_06365 [Pendulispora rubella]|uniref:Uncharacterized protein n=1 Tax=Pendulispora rubella TaxID=2741070 RepID=A0ABZ2L7X1_9BACT